MGNLTDLNFNAEAVDPNAKVGFDPIPDGQYIAMITDSEKKTSKKSGTDYLMLCFEIDGPTHEGKLIFLNLNLWHSNEKARQISQANLSAICRAVGVMTPKGSEDLHDRLMKIKVSVKKNKETGELQNQIDKFEPYKKTTVAPSSTPVNAEKEESFDEPF